MICKNCKNVIDKNYGYTTLCENISMFRLAYKVDEKYQAKPDGKLLMKVPMVSDITQCSDYEQGEEPDKAELFNAISLRCWGIC